MDSASDGMVSLGGFVTQPRHSILSVQEHKARRGCFRRDHRRTYLMRWFILFLLLSTPCQAANPWIHWEDISTYQHIAKSTKKTLRDDKLYAFVQKSNKGIEFPEGLVWKSPGRFRMDKGGDDKALAGALYFEALKNNADPNDIDIVVFVKGGIYITKFRIKSNGKYYITGFSETLVEESQFYEDGRYIAEKSFSECDWWQELFYH